ncbi:MAG: A24 family peptidase [Planctomycetota bacterium]|jgi:prepilin peptidase CpaA
MLISLDSSESAAIFQWGVVLGASLAAALWDLNTRRIPNWLTFPLFLSGLVQAVVFGGFGFDGLGGSLLAGAILGLPYVILFLFAGGGAGDAKIMIAAGTWLGMGHILEVLFCVSVFGIAIALLKALLKGQFFAVLNNIRVLMLSFFVFFGTRGKVNTVKEMAEQAEDEKLTVPYGPAIFAGLLCAGIYNWICCN